MCSQGRYPGEKSNSNEELNENCSQCSGRAVGLALDPGFCVSLHPVLFYRGPPVVLCIAYTLPGITVTVGYG